MKFLAVFLLSFLPLCALLFALQEDLSKTSRLPDEAGVAQEPIIQGKDLAGEEAEGALAGRVLQLEGVRIRVTENAALKAYARFGRLVRHQNRTRITDVVFGLFEDDRLELTIEAPFVEGDARRLLRPRKNETRVATFGGGVVVRDRNGRPMARVERLSFDLDKNTLESSDDLTLEIAEKGLFVKANGLFADLDKKTGFVRLERAVSGSVAAGDERARFRCRGPARLVETGEDRFMVVLEGDAEIEHPDATARCPRIEAHVHRVGEKQELESAKLTGGVEIAVSQDVEGGLEKIRADTVTIAGDVVTLVGNATSVRRGPIEHLGMGDRVLDIKASRIRLAPAGNPEKKKRLWRIQLDDVVAKDRGGPGVFRARRATFDQSNGRFRATGGFFAKSVEGEAEGEELDGDKKTLVMFGDKCRIKVAVDGRLGPLGKRRRGDLSIEAERLGVRHEGERRVFTASGGVTGALTGGSSLTCGSLQVRADGDRLEVLRADRDVVLVETERGARIEGDSLHYENAAVDVRGEPAVVVSKKHGRVTGKKLRWHEDGRFSGAGDVAVDARLARDKKVARWRVRCGRVTGKLRENDTPESVDARDGVDAQGPEGQSFVGERFTFDGKTGKAVLLGKPARVRRGKDLYLAAPEIELLIKDEALAEARTKGAAVIEFRAAKKKSLDFARWDFALAGDARLVGDTLVVPAGGTFRAYDEKGALRVEGKAGRVGVKLEREGDGFKPVRLDGSEGVDLTSHGKQQIRVEAGLFSYLVGSKEIDVRRNVRVKGKGWDKRVTLDRAVFVLTKDGVDLRDLTGVKVRQPKR